MAITTALLGVATEYTGSNHSSSAVATVGGSIHAAGGDSVILCGMFVRSNTDTPSISAVDSKGNSYTLITPYGHGAGANTVGAFILAAHNVIALTTGDTITLTVGACNGCGVVASDVAWGAGQKGATDASAGQNSGGSATVSSGASGTVADSHEAIFGALAAFATGDDVTAGAGWTSIALANPSPAFPLRAEQQMQDGTATGTYNATGTGVGTVINGAGAVASFKAVVTADPAAITLISGSPALGLGVRSDTAAVGLVSGSPRLSVGAGERFLAAVALISASPVLRLTDAVLAAGAVYLLPGHPALSMSFGVQPTAAIGLHAAEPVIALGVSGDPAAAVSLMSDAPTLTIMVSISYPHTGALRIDSVTPNFGGGITDVVILGAGFLGTTAVNFGPYGSYGADVGIPPTVISDTELHVTAPPSPFYLAGGTHDPLLVDVRVFTVDAPTGSPIVAADHYTFLAPPVVYAVVPPSGTTLADTPVTLFGKNLEYPLIAVNLGPFGAETGTFTGPADGTSLVGVLATTNFIGNGVGAYPLRLANAAGFSDAENPTFTVYPGQTPEPPPESALDDALSGRYGPVALRYRFEQRDRSFGFIADLTPAVDAERGCIVHLNNEQPVARTADFILSNPELLPASFDPADPATFNIAVFAEIDVPGSGTVSIPLGLLHLDVPAAVQYGNGQEEWQAKGADLTFVLADRTTPLPYVVPQNSLYLDVVAGLCRQFGLQEAVSLIPGAGYRTPVDFLWPARTTYLQIANDLLFGINFYPLWADAQGVLLTRPRVDPAQEAPAVGYSTEAEPRMLIAPSTRTPNVGSLNNQVSVAIDDPSREPAVATRTNTDPASPLSTSTSGKLNFKAITGNGSPASKCVFNSAVAAVIADFEVRSEAARALRRALETEPDPRRTNREWYQLSIEGAEAQSLWRVVSWDLTCAAGGPHTHTVEYAQAITVTGSGSV